MTISNLCDESEPVTFDEAQNLENWMAAMQSEYDAILQNVTWTLCDLLPPGKSHQNMMLLCKMVHGVYVTCLMARKPLSLNGCIS